MWKITPRGTLVTSSRKRHPPENKPMILNVLTMYQWQQHCDPDTQWVVYSNTPFPLPINRIPHSCTLTFLRLLEINIHTCWQRYAIYNYNCFLRRVNSFKWTSFVCRSADSKFGKRNCGTWVAFHQWGSRIWTRCKRKEIGAEKGEAESDEILGSCWLQSQQRSAGTWGWQKTLS